MLAGGCSEAELSLPYLPFLEAIGNHLGRIDATELAHRLGPAADELAQLFPQLGRPAAAVTDATVAKMRLFESMLILLRDVARERALLLILEDLQWADPATRALLDYATRRLRSTNVLVVATYRTDEMHRKHALLPTIQGWRRNGQVDLVELKPLDSAQVAAMVCAIFEETSISNEFRDFLHERSEGNPFVLEEMLRDAIDRGDIFRTDNGWDRKSLLEASIAAQLIEEEEDRVGGRYRFRHALTREAIYEDLVLPRRQQLHSRVADVLKTASNGTAVDLANHLFVAGRNDEAVAMCVTAAADANRARAFRDAAELLERAAPFVADPIERARMHCRAAEAYWNNTESPTAKRLLEQAIPELEAAGLMVEAAGYRVLLGRCWWELLRTDRAREEFEKARDVLEPHGPSEALAVAYIRLSGIASFNEDREQGLELAIKAYDIAERAGAEGAKAWSLNFRAIAEVGLGRVEEGFAAIDQSYRSAVAAGAGFPVRNAVYNASWLSVHLARGRDLTLWLERLEAGDPVTDEPWLPYMKGLAALERGQVNDALRHATNSLQNSREAGHEKMVWRSEVLLAHVLAEMLNVDQAVATMPALSRRSDAQDVIYDCMPRIRCRLAAQDAAGADAEARTVVPTVCGMGSPADSVAQGAADAAWLRSFLDQIPARGEVLASPRIAAARGRLALAEGHFDDARELLTAAVAEFEKGRFLLDVWHTGSALAEAEHRCGNVDGAEDRLRQIASQAGAAEARLAARIARDTATRIGFDIGPAAEPAAQPASASRITPGERMVSVLFADVRGYSRLAGQTPPAELADRISALQRWATHEVERRNGVVDKFAGDAVMATFNISGQSVDHALQAFRAAIALIDKAALAGLPVGAAVAVGPAVVGNLAESANLSVLGPVTNLASRLQAVAGAGEVMLAEEAYRRSREWLEAQRVPVERVELELKGFEGAVVAYRVRSQVAEAASA